MNLDNKDFDDRQQNYRRMRWMQQGLDPDEMEAKWCEEKETRAEARRERLKQENAERRRREEELKNSALVANDKRFQAAVTDRKFKKQKFIASDKLNELVVQRKTTPAAGKKVTKKKGPKSRPQ
ncbi:probable ATP-dependent RNA helicase Dbp45A isoform X2 [Anopheles cruzii]|nr:probable ATP-dependent RNA helicase Dbp45A isoform X2 [Anopheles cruzii]